MAMINVNDHTQPSHFYTLFPCLLVAMVRFDPGSNEGVEGGKLAMCELQLATLLVYFIDSVFNQRECQI